MENGSKNLSTDFQVSNSDLAVSVMWVNPENMMDNAVAEASVYLPRGPKHWYLNRVMVKDPDRRGHGIGGRILERLLDELKERQAVSVIVEPGGYQSDVRRLISFYESHGFQKRKRDLGFYLEWTAPGAQ